LSVAFLFWAIAWSMCGTALCCLAGLVLYRTWANRCDDGRRVERRDHIEALKAKAERPAGAGSIRADDVLTDLAVDILELVRGDEKARFAERLVRAGVSARLHHRLRRGGVRTRILSAAALANFHDPATRQALERALDDPHPEVRLTAALALAAHGDAPPPAALIGRLALGDGERSLLIVLLLAECARHRAEGVRSLLADPSAVPGIRAAAAEALALCDDFAAVPLIAALAMESDSRAPELPRYLGALAEIEHPAGLAAVLHGLRSPAPAARAGAARAAGRIMLEEAIGPLGRLVGDGDWWVRFRAAESLLRLDQTGKSLLHGVARGGNARARTTAEGMLAEHANAG
jgi:HEAT repeat protein